MIEGIKELESCSVLVFTGAAGAGKDTLANLVRRVHEEWTESGIGHIKFSAPLKEACCAIFGWDLKRMDEQEYKAETLPVAEWVNEVGSDRTKRSRRAILQYLGTDIFRQMDQDVWVKEALRRAVIEDHRIYVCTDCRFQNEQEALTEYFGRARVVHIVRRGGPEQNVPEHVTESGIGLPPDYTFTFDWGDFAAMRRAAEFLYTELTRPSTEEDS